MSSDLGGNDFCHGIGHWLRHHAVAGLVYPSARTDAGVTYDDRNLVSFKGWNLVVYQGAPVSGFQSAPFYPGQCVSHKVVDYSPWLGGWGPEVRIATMQGGSAVGSWQVRGLQDWQAELFRAHLEKTKNFESWQSNSESK
jgi:hypothetical protein